MRHYFVTILLLDGSVTRRGPVQESPGEDAAAHHTNVLQEALLHSMMDSKAVTSIPLVGRCLLQLIRGLSGISCPSSQCLQATLAPCGIAGGTIQALTGVAHNAVVVPFLTQFTALGPRQVVGTASLAVTMRSPIIR